MKILIICSKAFYKSIPPIKQRLEEMGHSVELPNSYYYPEREAECRTLGEREHSEFVAKMLRMSQERISQVDAVLALNFEKNGIENYIGGATFLELYDAFMSDKKIYLYNDIPRGILYDEISGFLPIVIHGNTELVV